MKSYILFAPLDGGAPLEPCEVRVVIGGCRLAHGDHRARSVGLEILVQPNRAKEVRKQASVHKCQWHHTRRTISLSDDSSASLTEAGTRTRFGLAMLALALALAAVAAGSTTNVNVVRRVVLAPAAPAARE